MSNDFVLGVDLDGVCADFYEKMRVVVAEWQGLPIEDLTENVTYGLPEWGLWPLEYDRIHHFAVTQRNLFSDVALIPGAVQALRRLSNEGVRIRIITNRLFIPHFHKTAVAQTVEWLDNHAIPYSDLCFVKDKQGVNANIYVDDSPSNIASLQVNGKVIAFTNSTNHNVTSPLRASSWREVEQIVRDDYYSWRTKHGLTLPDSPGHEPPERAPQISGSQGSQ